jgi:hypothetical protein
MHMPRFVRIPPIKVRKRSATQAIAVVSLLMSVLLVGRPDAAFAHGQSSGAPTKSAAIRLGTASTTIVTLVNRHTTRCIDDSPAYGLRAFTCNNSYYQQFFVTPHGGDAYRNFYVLQNVQTGSCMTDDGGAPPHGLHGDYCDNFPHQQFIITTYDNNVWVLQNVNTGSCVDDSYLGLRGYFCNSYDFQQWTPL